MGVSSLSQGGVAKMDGLSADAPNGMGGATAESKPSGNSIWSDIHKSNDNKF